jgi:hypothetical protein
MNAKQVVIIVLALVGLFWSFASAETPSGGNTGTGIEGVIMISPAMPGPAREGMPDTKPVANVTWVVQTEKAVVASFNTDSEGRFRVSLPPGHYTVSRKEHMSRIGHYGPFEVDVAPGKMTTVEWKCDSGMR